jgi:hypothetical protein
MFRKVHARRSSAYMRLYFQGGEFYIAQQEAGTSMICCKLDEMLYTTQHDT